VATTAPFLSRHSRESGNPAFLFGSAGTERQLDSRFRGNDGWLAGLVLAFLLLAACRQGPVAPVVANAPQAEAPPSGNVVLGNMELPAERAAEMPPLSGRVVDNANLLTPEQETALSARSEALERQTGAQFVIATIPSLGGRPIAAYATALGNHWGLGQADRDNGVLLLIAPTERQVRLALGTGLAASFADAEAQLIIDRDLLPAFRESRFFDGIDRASQAIAARVTRAGAGQGARR
jgi:hypothetical protein